MDKLQTELNNRILRFDGVSIIEPEKAYDMLLRGVPPSKLILLDVDESIEQFNSLVAEADQVKQLQNSPVKITAGWLLPPEYLNLDVETRIGEKFEQFLQIHSYNDAQIELAMQRVVDELDQIKRRGMTEFVRTIIYVMDVFKQRNQVWGVGRGSSCASYILFLLNVHAVDCIKYNIDMDEFFHD